MAQHRSGDGECGVIEEHMIRSAGIRPHAEIEAVKASPRRKESAPFEPTQEVNEHIIDVSWNRVRRAVQVEVRLAQHIILADHIQVHPAYPLLFQILMLCQVCSSSVYLWQPEKPDGSFKRRYIPPFCQSQNVFCHLKQTR